MLALRHGDYMEAGDGLRSVTGREALLQRVMMKLTARRGQFPFMEDLGSRLWTLGRLKASERQAAAEQYVVEALSDEAGLTVESVTLAAGEAGRMTLTAVLSVSGDRLTVEAAL